MIDLIVSWVAGIVFVTLFATFLELLLPSSSMQKFVRVIMGLMIMLAILNPVIDFLEYVTTRSDVVVFAPPHTPSAAIEERAQFAARKRDQLAKDIYRRDLAKQMQSLVMGVEGVANASVKVECTDEQNGLMKIQLVTVSVQPGAKEQVKRVVINRSHPDTAVLQPEIVANIQRRIGELYYLQHHQIIVDLLNK